MWNTIFCKLASEKQAMEDDLALNGQGCSQIHLRFMVKFWDLITLKQELSSKHLEEPLSLTITCIKNCSASRQLKQQRL